MIFRKTDFRLQLDGSGKLRRRGKDGIISWYDFDMRKENQLKILKFASYSEQWLDFILNCRRGKDATDYKGLRYEQPKLQICFRTE